MLIFCCISVFRRNPPFRISCLQNTISYSRMFNPNTDPLVLGNTQIGVELTTVKKWFRDLCISHSPLSGKLPLVVVSNCVSAVTISPLILVRGRSIPWDSFIFIRWIKRSRKLGYSDMKPSFSGLTRPDWLRRNQLDPLQRDGRVCYAGNYIAHVRSEFI